MAKIRERCLRQKKRETGRERVNEKEAPSKWKKHKEDSKKKSKKGKRF